MLLTDIESNLFDASGHVIADSTGNLHAVAGLSVWSTNPPGAQPAAIADAADLASVIAAFNTLKADVAAYGLIAQ